MIVVLACALLSAAAPPARLAAVTGPALPGRGALLVAGGLLLVADPPVLVGYTPTPRPAARWTATVTAPAWSAEAVDDLVLVTERDTARQVVGTSAYDAATGALRWRRPDRVYPAGDGAVAVTEVRSVADPGQRIHGLVHGVDPATGADRWSVSVPSTAVLAVAPGRPGRVVLVHDSGLTRLHAVRDGAVLGAARLPPAGYAPDNPLLVGDHLVLRHPAPGGTALSGYDLPSLAPRWRRLLAGGEVTEAGCPGLVCLRAVSDRRALDPATGDLVWRWPGGAGWQVVPGGRDADRVVLVRAAGEGGRTLVSTAGPDGPHPAGVLPAGARDCHAVDGALACRGPDNRLTVWSLRSAG
ncbi:PQQ-binding-like beta-propeller repeat protein [Micromonospora chersina]|uniref:outer membrane protein assembly factor BamB family protein n=1 Tax=Micromonospora chersina TaxID=47854 RepID=UPI003D909945